MRKPTAVMFVLSLAVLALALVPAAGLAAKGGNGGGHGGGGKPGGGGGSSSGGSYSVTVSPGGPYFFGQAVYVTTDTPTYPNNTGPWISLECYQDGFKVGGADHAGFSGGWYYGDPFYLGPTQMWASGSADCTVTVWHNGSQKAVVDAQTSFHVEP